jgi:hypothetical protein
LVLPLIVSNLPFFVPEGREQSRGSSNPGRTETTEELAGTGRFVADEIDSSAPHWRDSLNPTAADTKWDSGEQKLGCLQGVFELKGDQTVGALGRNCDRFGNVVSLRNDRRRTDNPARMPMRTNIDFNTASLPVGITR